MNLQPPSMDS